MHRRGLVLKRLVAKLNSTGQFERVSVNEPRISSCRYAGVVWRYRTMIKVGAPMRNLWMVLPLILGACADNVGPAAAPQRHAQEIAPARPVGKPMDCVPITHIRASHVLSDRIIDFELIDRSTLRNTLPYDCPGLGFEEAFTYSTSLSQLCSTDIIIVLDRGGGLRRGASCGLGRFQPVQFPKR